MPPTKEMLRSQLKQARRELSTRELTALHSAISARLVAIIMDHPLKNLHSYIPISAEHEADTWSLLHALWQQRPEVRVAVPDPPQEYQAVYVNGKTDWTVGNRQTRPLYAVPADSDEQFEVIIVPLLGFDEAGYRLGYGGGFYDRFLATQPQALTIGLGFEQSLVTGFPREAHDIPLQMIITEQRLIHCK